jgi:hypothetical protein
VYQSWALACGGAAATSSAIKRGGKQRMSASRAGVGDHKPLVGRYPSGLTETLGSAENLASARGYVTIGGYHPSQSHH